MLRVHNMEEEENQQLDWDHLNLTPMTLTGAKT